MPRPDELKIVEYEQGVKLLDDIRRELDAGEIMSIVIIAETTGGEVWSGCTRTQNVFMLAGAMLAWACSRLGFINDRMFQKSETD